MRFHAATGLTKIRKSTLAILTAFLLLGTYIGFLMASNYRSQVALSESALERFQLDLEKRAVSLGYFFSERKYDLRSMASSREISAYFINRSLGMSEQYGLKVSLFVIGEMLRKTIAAKWVQGDGIYERFLLVDQRGRPLVDTLPQEEGDLSLSGQRFKMIPQRGEPTVLIDEREGKIQILLVVGCYYKDQFAGQLIGWLNLATLFDHFIEFSRNLSRKGLCLVTADGRLIYPPGEKDHSFGTELEPNAIAQLPMKGFSSLTLFSEGRERHKMLVARLPIHDVPLNLLAIVPGNTIFGSVAPWQLLVGTGSLALVILAGIGVLMRFNNQKLILKARFEESQRQQGLLASKNLELKDEIWRRQEAEKKLEEQRTLRMRSDRLRSLGEMAAGIAHELNQPLVGVRGMAELILLSTENGNKTPQGEIRNNLSLIIEQADRMVHIIRHVRLFARDAGNPETSLVDLNDVVRSGMGLLATQFRSQGLHLEDELAPYSLPVRVNPFSVEEVILNLLSNARDALEKRKQEEADYIPRVCLSSRRGKKEDENIIRLEVRDNGEGIPQSIADKVFDPFFTTKDPDKGTGLGLAICKSIIEEMGGNIQFESIEGEGTVFTIGFPAQSNEEENTNEYVE